MSKVKKYVFLLIFNELHVFWGEIKKTFGS